MRVLSIFKQFWNKSYVKDVTEKYFLDHNCSGMSNIYAHFQVTNYTINNSNQIQCGNGNNMG